MTVWPRFMIRFSQEFVHFRLAELDAVIEMTGAQVSYDATEYRSWSPFMTVRMASNDDAHKLLERAILIKSIYRLIDEADTYEELFVRVKAAPMDWIIPHENSSFRVVLHSYGHHMSETEQLKKINSLAFLPLKGPVQLKEPELTLALLEDYTTREKMEEPINFKKTSLRHVCLAIMIAENIKGRTAADIFSLRKRTYIGNTSMDPKLSLVMANLGKVQSGMFVFDPFVGTGSFLCTCAYFGALVFGSDIDPIQIRGKKAPVHIRFNERRKRVFEDVGGSVIDNMHQYGLEKSLLGTLICDASTLNQCLRSNIQFDAIVTDPPYGVRAGARKLGVTQRRLARKERLLAEGKSVAPIPGILRVPSTVPYELEEVIEDLVLYAAQHLKVGGRLVFWLPTTEDHRTDDLPGHVCMKLISDCPQHFHHWTRRLLTFEKISEWTSDGAVLPEHRPAHGSFVKKYFKMDQMRDALPPLA